MGAETCLWVYETEEGGAPQATEGKDAAPLPTPSTCRLARREGPGRLALSGGGVGLSRGEASMGAPPSILCKRPP